MKAAPSILRIAGLSRRREDGGANNNDRHVVLPFTRVGFSTTLGEGVPDELCADRLPR